MTFYLTELCYPRLSLVLSTEKPMQLDHDITESFKMF